MLIILLHNHITQFFKKENMPRISSEKAAQAVGNRYDLILIASQRVRELKSGHRAKVDIKAGPSVTALTEIEEGLVGRDYLKRVKEDIKNREKRFK
jgi:DNA-directed RNA polymerase subunit omega